MSDSRDLAHREPQVPATAGEVIGGVLAMAKDPSIDAAKVETLTKLAITLQDRERQAEFNRDKNAAVREMPAIYKRGKSDKHRYAKFEDLHRAVMPILARHNLTLDFRIGSKGNLVTCQPILRHDNGYVEEGGIMEGPPDQGPGRTPIQAIGSSASYLKRHSTKAILNLIEDGEDDDGRYGHREGEQKNDRQERLILDAEAAAATADYPDWYGRQTTKDKAFLVQNGTHARCGGGTVTLPRTSSSPVGRGDREEPIDAEVEPVVDEPAAGTDQRRRSEPDPEPEAEPDPTTPEGWTTIFERNCAAAENDQRLREIESAGAKALQKLADGHPKLWERADRALLDARDRIKAAPPATDGGLFGGEEPAK